ncbi:MAG: hypothetical protein ACKOBQ_05140 [Bacteroidota bacterium]
MNAKSHEVHMSGFSSKAPSAALRSQKRCKVFTARNPRSHCGIDQPGRARRSPSVRRLRKIGVLGVSVRAAHKSLTSKSK